MAIGLVAIWTNGLSENTVWEGDNSTNCCVQSRSLTFSRPHQLGRGFDILSRPKLTLNGMLDYSDIGLGLHSTRQLLMDLCYKKRHELEADILDED